MEVSNPDRVVFPKDGITKGDVVDYYVGVADRMLPFIEGRLLSVERFPRGIGGQGFMQKNVPDHAPEELIGRREVPKEGGGTTVYPMVDSVEGIAFFANLGVITFHVPPVRADDEEHADWVIWDLDPPAGSVELVREAAREMRAVLETFGIDTVLMTSGSKGYHLRALLEPTTNVDDVALVARGTAAIAAVANDGLLTLAFRKADRGERVFVDWMRNSSRSTSVVPWSLRPKAGAPVATPISWQELGAIEPDGVGLRNVQDRSRKRPWSKLEPIDLRPAVEKVRSALDDSAIELEPFDRFRS
ncbi:MAG: non-homologous end-joining DNA ligase [Acidimicrobiia bacterium]